MKKLLIYIFVVAAVFAVIYFAFEMSAVIMERVSYARRRAYWAELQRQDNRRNLYLMAMLPEYFAGSYYRGRWHDTPGRLVIFVVEGGYLAAGELGIYRDADIFEYIEYFDYRSRTVQRPIMFTYARLRETKAAVTSVMEARPRCVYTRNITGPHVRVTRNRVVMQTRNLSQQDFEGIVAGFRQHVYDSEMIEFENVFYLCLGGGQGSYKPAALLLAVIVATVLFIIIEVRKARRKQRQ